MEPLLEQRPPDGGLQPQPSPPPPRREGGGWAKLAALLAACALAVSCVTLYLQLRPAPREEPEAALPQAQEVPTIQYRDRVLPVLENVAVNAYDRASFARDESSRISYPSAAVGIDVSSYQGEVDWEQVAGAGVEFVMLRCGYRGYSKGAIMSDKNFAQNIRGALDAGLQVGVYFFSQATSVWEAEEEADYVLEAIRGYDVAYPVAFDWEFIYGSGDARTNEMKPEAVTRFAGAFCDRIAQAGYTPLIYFNQDLGYLTYQLDRLTDYTFWLAEYNAAPAFYYHFDLWQYSHAASVPGISGAVDLDLDLRGAAASR